MNKWGLEMKTTQVKSGEKQARRKRCKWQGYGRWYKNTLRNSTQLHPFSTFNIMVIHKGNSMGFPCKAATMTKDYFTLFTETTHFSFSNSLWYFISIHFFPFPTFLYKNESLCRDLTSKTCFSSILYCKGKQEHYCFHFFLTTWRTYIIYFTLRHTITLLSQFQ